MKKTFCIIAFLCLTCICQAQTSYVDVNPDSCVCAHSGSTTSQTVTALWDLDNNGSNDFMITSTSLISDCMHGYENTAIKGLGNNKIAGDSACTNCNNAFMLNAGDTINKQSSWLSSAKFESYNEFNSAWSGHWKDSLFPNEFKYIAVKFYAGATLYCGWMRLNVNVNCGIAKVLVTEYAYGICSNNYLASVSEIKSADSPPLYPNPNNGSFTLKIDRPINNGEIALINAIGQKVYEQPVSQGLNQIIVYHLAKGLYSYILFQDKKQAACGKLSIE